MNVLSLSSLSPSPPEVEGWKEAFNHLIMQAFPESANPLGSSVISPRIGQWAGLWTSLTSLQ